MNKKQYSEIQKCFDVYVEKYDVRKYPVDIYKKAKLNFANLKPNKNEIADALHWKYGNIGKSNFPKSHKLIVKEVVDSWRHFQSSNATKSPRETFDWWKDRLASGKNRRFVTIAFITHLIHHRKNVPIIDQHNFRALNYLLNNSVLSSEAKRNPSNWEDVECLKGLISNMEKNLNKKKDEIDKYLMMFGKELKQK
jgi:hypothetical protein